MRPSASIFGSLRWKYRHGYGTLLAVFVFMVMPVWAAAQITRLANTTLALPQDPQTFGYSTEDAFAGITFDQPLAIVTPPGETDRIFIVEKPGRIQVVTGLSSAPTKALFFDLTSRVLVGNATEEGLLGLAFHPDFATNHYFYLFYTVDATTAAGTGRHDRLSRFTVQPGATNADILASEVPLISQYDEASNHNGGDLHFGPDGYLYVALGDEGSGNDAYQNSQLIDQDFFSGLLRIDVDQLDGNLIPHAHASVHAGTYKIPADNPFVGATSFNGIAVTPANVRSEFWAVGLRNPWRFSFDVPTGRLLLGDVGQSAREEIDLITRGGNYGWNYREGGLGGPKPNPPVGAAFIEPIYEFDRSHASSITGGIVYRGNRFTQLSGRYVFGDYGTGRLFFMTFPANAPAEVETSISVSGIVGFGADPRNGDVLIASITTGLLRLVYSASSSGTPLPATLSATGAFSDLATLTPAAGVVAYEPTVSFWSDYAQKRRWFSVPALADKITFAADGSWTFPEGTVWVKHFDLELTRGEPATARRLETRFLVKTAGGIYGVTYKWNPAQTEATLVPEEGATETIMINDVGTIRPQTWRYPSRSECMQCHTAVAGHALSFNTAQLNRSVSYPSGSANQLSTLANAGYFDASVPDPATLRSLAAASDLSATVEHRVRSYLAANCAQCHQPGGAALGNWDARIETPTASAGLIDGLLVDTRGDSANRVVALSDPTHSVLLARISTRGAGQMPPLASTELDSANIALLSAWISPLLVAPVFTTQPSSQVATVGDTVTFSAVASGSPLPTYQWQKDGVGIAGATSNTYTLSDLHAGDAGNYTVVATNSVSTVTSNTATLTVNKAVATVSLSSLSAVYDGSSHAAAATTTPASLAVNFTYDGSPTAPTNAGTYAVVGTISDTNYQGTAAGSLVIAKAPATVTLGNLNAPYNGAPQAASATTVPSSLVVNFTYNGSPTAPTNAGTYAVVGTISDPNYQGSAAGSLVIANAPATVTLGNLNGQYNGTPQAASATTVPSSLVVNFTYNGSPTAPTNAGTYAVVGTISDPNYQGSAAGSLVIAQGAATVTLGNLNGTYSGAQQPAFAITVPSSLAVNFTYDGSPTAPTNAGTYAVVGTISDANYQGSATGSLVIAKGAATVTLGNLNGTYNGAPQAASATTVPSSLAVNFTYNGSPTAPTNAGTYAVVGTISDANYQGSATGSLLIAKAPATVTLGNLNGTYNGAPQAASATTVPSSLAVNFTYDGSPTAPTNAGTYAVVGTISDPNYQGSAAGSLVIAKGAATVTLGNLNATYDATAHTATATTTPAALAVGFTYNGAGTAPTDAGTYSVVGTISDANYAGSEAGSLVIAKAVPVLTWPVPTPVVPGIALSSAQLNATCNVPGVFSYSPVNGTIMTAGVHALAVIFTPADTANYSNISAQQTLSVLVAPVVTVQPVSRAAFVGDSVLMSCVVSGIAPLTYQWQKGGIAIPGATQPTLTLTNVQLNDAGSYALVATNEVGGSVTSRFARLVVIVPQQNAITYATTVSSTGVTAGGVVNFDYFVTNVGTKVWGANHYLSIRDVNNTFVAFSPLIGIFPGETTTANLNFPAPTTPGTYTYYVQALENGIEFFSTQTVVTLTVLAPLANAITYNTTTFPVSAAPGSKIIFTYNVTNTGTAPWGVDHFLSLKNAGGSALSSTPLTVLAPGASKTVNLSLSVPSSPGTYHYVVQASQTGVGDFGTEANLTLVALAPRPNAIVYNRIRYPDEVVPEAGLNLKYTLSNAGTQSWGAAHYVSLRDSASNYLAFIPLSGTAPAATKSVEFTLTAPTAPGTYTYYVQALEDGIEFFSTQDVVIVKVVALPLGNAISYNSSTFPVTVSAGATVNFTANVTNRGTRTWGATHYLSFRDVDNTFLAFPTLNGVAPGASRTANLSFTAPATPGIYTYTLQAFEDGVSFFEMADTVVLLVQ